MKVTSFYGTDRPPLARCYESHKPLPIGDYLLYGGNCQNPVVTDADIYVGFDFITRRGPKTYPWNSGEEFYYPIPDMGVPASLDDFDKLLEYLELQLIAGKKVHIGCFGGHGRTGLVMAALVTRMTGEVDSIQYVRDNYCGKAVESDEQIAWLVNNFGITSRKPVKKNISNGRGKGSSARSRLSPFLSSEDDVIYGIKQPPFDMFDD